MMKYTAFSKDGQRMEGFESLDYAFLFVGEGGWVEDEDGNVVLTWDEQYGTNQEGR